MVTGTWQPAPILFPDAEQWAADYLRGRIDAALPEYSGHEHEAYVGTEKPDKRWELMVVVRRDGGGSTGIDDFPRLSVRTWAMSEPVVNQFTAWVLAQLLDAPGHGPCKAVRHTGGPLRVPDPQTTRQRLSTVELRLRGAVLAPDPTE